MFHGRRWRLAPANEKNEIVSMMNITIHELDQERVADARAWQDILEQQFKNNSVSIHVRPAYRGSWRVGYTYSGRFCVTFTYKKGGGGHVSKRYYTERNTDKVVRYYDKNLKSKVLLGQGVDRINGIYRRSGLIPKHIARKHSQWLKDNNLSYFEDKEAQNKLILRMARYIQRWGICPNCQHRGGWQETILGWNCETCGHTWDDTNLEDQKWIPNP